MGETPGHGAGRVASVPTDPAPLPPFRSDRQAARDAGDANAELCWLALTLPDGTPTVRALVLRDLGDDLAVFINATSPKWTALTAQPRWELACWFPSLQRQWRMRGVARTLDASLLETHWPRRPRTAQVMDHVYRTRYAQSSELPASEALLDAWDAIDANGQPLEAPMEALAIHLDVDQAECVQIAQPPTLHARCAWNRTAEDWDRVLLVP